MVRIERKCPFCGGMSVVWADPVGCAKWKFGKSPIQEAFPEMSGCDREVLITGLCGPCQDDVFMEEEEETAVAEEAGEASFLREPEEPEEEEVLEHPRMRAIMQDLA